MRMRLLLLLCLAATSLPAATDTNRHVIVVSIDGLRPVFYLPGAPSAACPTLVALRERGSYAQRAISVYPSLTYPAHTSIVTGVNPARHGVTGNSVFAPLTEKDGRGFWYAADIKAPALWDVMHAAGGTVGAVSWPCSAGTEAIAWNLPEFWSSLYGHEVSLTRQYANPEVLRMAEEAAAPMNLQTLLDMDRRDTFLAASAEEIIREKKPELMLVHFVESDHDQHRLGPSSPQIPKTMTKIDGLVSGLVATVESAGMADQTTVIILGDHGFADVKQRIAPNVLLARHGFITVANGKVQSWKAMVLNSGGSAGVYVNPQAPTGTAAAVKTLLEANTKDVDGKPLYEVISRERLTELGGPAQAAFYLEGEPGYMFSLTWTGEDVVRPAPLKGNHGFLPTKPEMATGFIICGRGVKPGVVLPQMHLIDVAPTVAALLGASMPSAEGRVLTEMLAPDGQ